MHEPKDTPKSQARHIRRPMHEGMPIETTAYCSSVPGAPLRRLAGPLAGRHAWLCCRRGGHASALPSLHRRRVPRPEREGSERDPPVHPQCDRLPLVPADACKRSIHAVKSIHAFCSSLRQVVEQCAHHETSPMPSSRMAYWASACQDSKQTTVNSPSIRVYRCGSPCPARNSTLAVSLFSAVPPRQLLLRRFNTSSAQPHSARSETLSRV